MDHSAPYSHFLTRFLAIVGLGAIISAGETALGDNPSGIDWGVLQAIGMAGLLTLIVISLPSTWRWIIGAGILVVYQIVLDHFLLDLTLRSPHGGLFGITRLVSHDDPRHCPGGPFPRRRPVKKSLPLGVAGCPAGWDCGSLPAAGQQASRSQPPMF